MNATDIIKSSHISSASSRGDNKFLALVLIINSGGYWDVLFVYLSIKPLSYAFNKFSFIFKSPSMFFQNYLGLFLCLPPPQQPTEAIALVGYLRLAPPLRSNPSI